MRYSKLDEVKLEGKRVLLRIDINSPLKNKRIIGFERIQEHCKTIKELVRKKARIVIIAHQGRKGDSDFIHLQQHAKLLTRFCKHKVKFIPDLIGKRAIRKIEKLRNGEIILLDNLRLLKEENPGVKVKKSILVNKLAPLFDYFVFDAFYVAHRDNPSISGFSKKLPTLAGKVMEKEMRGLNKVDVAKRPYVLLLGGGKIEDCILLIEKKLIHVDFILCGGKIGIAGLIAKGHHIGLIDGDLRFIKNIKKFMNNKKIIWPVDLATEINGKRREFSVENFPREHNALDIGKETIKIYSKILLNAKTVYLKGPMGFYEKKGFEKGTKEILKAVANSKAFSIAGGGHTANTIDRFINRKKIGYFSLSGGALLEYMAGKKLPGIEALKRGIK